MFKLLKIKKVLNLMLKLLKLKNFVKNYVWAFQEFVNSLNSLKGFLLKYLCTFKGITNLGKSFVIYKMI